MVPRSTFLPADWYQLYLDDLPIWGMVGEVTTSEPAEGAAEPSEGDGEALLYTHKKFVVAYNQDRIIQVNLTSENPVALTVGSQVDFSYSVEWVQSDISFGRRFDRYLDYDFFEHQIHWFSYVLHHTEATFQRRKFPRIEDASSACMHAYHGVQIRIPQPFDSTNPCFPALLPQYLQFIHDGDLPHWYRLPDPHAHLAQRLCKVRPGVGRFG